MTPTEPAASHSATKDVPRLAALDGARLLAAAAVMVYHFWYIAPGAVIARHGYLGVDVFFMLSGFVILWSANGRTPAAFARARVLRLYPEFWLAVLISAAVFTLSPGGMRGPPSVSSVLANLTMVPQYLGQPYVDGVYWTLGAELKFYLLLWGMLLVRQAQHLDRWLIGWALVGAIGEFIDLGGVVRSLLILPYGSLFALGGLLFVATERGWTAPRAIGVGLAWFAGWHGALDRMAANMRPEDLTSAARMATIGVVTVATLGLALVRRVEPSPRAAAWLTTAGALTYPLYLLHNVPKELLLQPERTVPRVIGLPLAVVASVALAWVVQHAAARFVRPPLATLLGRRPRRVD